MCGRRLDRLVRQYYPVVRRRLMADYRAALRRYGVTGDAAALDQAIEHLEVALASAPGGRRRRRTSVLHDLSVCLQTRFALTAGREDLERMVWVAGQLIEAGK